MKFEIGTQVQRIGSDKDYTTGRIGEVIEIQDQRARVHWKFEKSGVSCNVRTWVRFQSLQIFDPSSSK